MSCSVFDEHRNTLGEGPLWHPLRRELFWFDITGRTMHAKPVGGERRSWSFPEPVSAAGWVDEETLVVASAEGLHRFDIGSGASELLVRFPQDGVRTRSNDGRADRRGGFWIGTMGLGHETGAGAIYRFHRGELRLLYDAVTIPNAICFTADGGTAYLADTRKGQVWRQRLDAEGWPAAEREVFLDYHSDGGPDGAVLDADGNFWIAEWGAGRVACYDGQGRLLRAVEVPASHTSCPAFGGTNLTTLFVTTAQEGLSADELAASPGAGQTFMAEPGVRGLEEARVVLA